MAMMAMTTSNSIKVKAEKLEKGFFSVGRLSGGRIINLNADGLKVISQARVFKMTRPGFISLSCGEAGGGQEYFGKYFGHCLTGLMQRLKGFWGLKSIFFSFQKSKRPEFFHK